MKSYQKESEAMRSKRHDKILELINNRNIETQEELLRLLRESGFNSTQATVSRDIKHLRLIKVPFGGGKYKYASSDNNFMNISPRFLDIVSKSITSMDFAMNMVVIKSIAGMAQGICASLDSIRFDEVIGTLAGDDTIFIVCRDEQSAKNLVSKIKKMIIGR